MRGSRKEQAEAYKSYVKTSAVGLEVGLSIIVAALLGYFFDKEFQTEPWGLIFGFVVGMLAAVKALWAFSKKHLKQVEQENKKESLKEEAKDDRFIN